MRLSNIHQPSLCILHNIPSLHRDIYHWSSIDIFMWISCMFWRNYPKGDSQCHSQQPDGLAALRKALGRWTTGRPPVLQQAAATERSTTLRPGGAWPGRTERGVTRRGRSWRGVAGANIILKILNWVCPNYTFCKLGTHKAHLHITLCYFTSLTQIWFSWFSWDQQNWAIRPKCVHLSATSLIVRLGRFRQEACALCTAYHTNHLNAADTSFVSQSHL